jgi:hypothetical protein
MKLFFALVCLLAVLGAYADRLQMEREVTKFDSDLWMQVCRFLRIYVAYMRSMS